MMTTTTTITTKTTIKQWMGESERDEDDGGGDDDRQTGNAVVIAPADREDVERHHRHVQLSKNQQSTFNVSKVVVEGRGREGGDMMMDDG